VKVPFYHQTFDFSCGPASLMMCLAALRPGYQTSRDEELAIWREATLMEIYGTSRYGLGLAAVRRGLRAVAVGLPGVCYIDAIGELRPEVDYDMMRTFQADLRRKALAGGVEELAEPMSLAHIQEALAQGGLPISLASTALFDPEEGDIPHWVVISDMENESKGGTGKVTAQNPLGNEGNTSLIREDWEASMGFGGVLEGLLLYPK